MGIKEKLIQVMSLNVVLWMAMLTVFTGLLFCAAGVYLALSAPFGPMAAALITGGGLIGLVVVVILLVALILSSEKNSKAKEIRNNPDNLLEHQLRPMLGDRATNWAKQNTGLATVGALSAGVILAASPRVRALLFGAAGPLVTRKAIQALQEFSDKG